MISLAKKALLLGVLGGILGGFLFQSSVALAISVPGVLTGAQNTIQTGEAITGVRLDTVLAAAGLKSGKFRDCTTSGILGLLANFLKNIKDQIFQLASEYLNTFFSTVARQLIYCALSDIQINIGGIFGGILKRIQPQCTIDIGGAATATFTNIKNQEIQRNFIANCVSRIMAERIKNDARQEIQTAGPFGSGPDWVQSWISIPDVAADRAQKRFWNELVNTPICPYMRDQIYAYFGVPQAYIDHPAPMTGISVDSGDPFPSRATCTLPDGFIPGNFNDPSTYMAMVTLITEPQNNPQGFIDMATSELTNQTNTLVTAAQNEAIAGGGLLSINDCMTYAPDGNGCLVPGPNKQVAATLTVSLQAATNAATSNYQQDAVNDIEAQFANDIINLANAPLPLTIELGPQYDSKNYQTPVASVIPPVPGDGSPNDPACIGSNTGCTCVKNDQTTQSALTPIVSAAMNQVMQNSPTLFSPPGTSTIAPGVNFRTVLQALCTAIDGGGSQTCTPSPSQDDTIIISSGLTFSMNVITPDGNLRTNGGQAILACPAGIQN